MDFIHGQCGVFQPQTPQQRAHIQEFAHSEAPLLGQ
jgi:hypothetical protein